jgi:hypothetical protein
MRGIVGTTHDGFVTNALDSMTRNSGLDAPTLAPFIAASRFFAKLTP